MQADQLYMIFKRDKNKEMNPGTPTIAFPANSGGNENA
jgi:hypothetical protein